MLLNVQDVIVCLLVNSIWTSSFGTAGHLPFFILLYSSLIHSFFNAGQQLTCPVRDHPEEFATSQSIVTDRDSAVPDANDHHDVEDVHLLKHCQKFVARAIFAIIVETFSEDLFLLDWIHLADPVGEYAIFSRCKL